MQVENKSSNRQEPPHCNTNEADSSSSPVLGCLKSPHLGEAKGYDFIIFHFSRLRRKMSAKEGDIKPSDRYGVKFLSHQTMSLNR
jgi:hypothetical protein